MQIGKETRRLLNDVSGYVKPGKLTALMGSSGASDGRTLSLTLPGAGKTTLLNVRHRLADGPLTPAGPRPAHRLGRRQR